MPIDLGNAPTGTPPTAEEKIQILSALGIPDVSTRSGAENLSNKTLVSPAFSGTATGQLEIPTQTMATDGSVITRSILAAEAAQSFLCPIGWNTPVASSGASGQTVGIASTLTVNGAAALGNNAYVTDFDNIQHNAGSGGNNRFTGSQFSIVFDLQSNGLSGTATEHRFLYGVASGAISLTAAGLGIIWAPNTSVRLQAHNGTTLQESSSFTIPSFSINNFFRFMVTWNGATWSLFIKSWVSTGSAPRWSFVGSITPTGMPTLGSGTKMVFANVATGATQSFASTLRIRSTYMAPFVMTI